MKFWSKKLSQLVMLALLVISSGVIGMQQLAASAELAPFVVGMECAYAPYNWTTPKGTDMSVEIDGGQYCDGFDVSMARAIANGLGRKLVIQKTSWDGLIPSLQSKQIDAIIAGMAPTEERKKEIAFSDIYYQGKFGVIVSKKGNYADAKRVQDFAGAKITAQMGTLHVQLISQLIGVNELSSMKDFPTMTVATKAKEVDGFIADIATGTTIASQNSDLEYIVLDGEHGFVTDESSAGIAVGLRKEDLELLVNINNVLSTISEADRDAFMAEAIDRQPGGAGDNQSFFAQIANLWENYSESFITGTIMTLLISIVSTILGILLGLLMAIIRNSSKIGRYLVTIYVTVIRGTPMMVQAMLFFYGSAIAFDFQWSSLWNGRIIAAIIIVTVNTGAYMAETIRGGIQSLDVGQFEASKSLGFTPWQTMTSIILPQALRNVLPALGNEFIVNIKDTSVLNVIGVIELFFMSSSVAGATYQSFATFTITAIIYLMLTSIFSVLLERLEKNIDKPKKSKV